MNHGKIYLKLNEVHSNKMGQQKILIREFRPWNGYYVLSDGTFWKDRLLTTPLKCDFKKQLSSKQRERTNKTTPEQFWQDFEEYNHVAASCRKIKIHQIMKRFLENPVPSGKFRYDRIDHIIPEFKCWNAIENLRYSNAHLNSINRLLLSDIYYDHDIHMWGAEFSTHCRGFKFYHAGFATSFVGIWKLYNQTRIAAYNEWDDFYISHFIKQNGLPQKKRRWQEMR